MKTLVLSTIIRILIPLFIGFSIYMFFRGHDKPGGGFIAGLITSIPFMLYSISFGYQETQRKYKIKPMFIAFMGLFLAASSGLFSIIISNPFMTGLWLDQEMPLIGKVGSPIFFDLGVYFLVFGTVLQITFLLSEE